MVNGFCHTTIFVDVLIYGFSTSNHDHRMNGFGLIIDIDGFSINISVVKYTSKFTKIAWFSILPHVSRCKELRDFCLKKLWWNFFWWVLARNSFWLPKHIYIEGRKTFLDKKYSITLKRKVQTSWFLALLHLLPIHVRLKYG